MDTLSSPVPSLNISSSLHSTPREFYHFKNPKSSHHHFLPPNPYFCYSVAKPANSISTKATLLGTYPFLSSSQHSSPKQSPSRTETAHQKAASGYATALLDVAQCNSSLEEVERDVKRLLKWLSNEQIRVVLNDPCVEEKEKGRVMKEVAEKGRFHRHLVKLVKLLIKKNKVGMASEVLQEFERIYDELNGTQLVFIPSEMKKMELKHKENLLFGIAKRAQKLSGAIKVKVKHCSFSSLQEKI
ncbi:ATP synthase delta chain, chloroplastic [Olea europaea var. sylvestris]|uniref:ATP synthase delta chain, chloroplastic n=1 Tax=Olea europaea var. sylvestris TaxID=158386 RepID=UPI000C1D0DBF|nr:ATP synthase delta chain, chloroplastic [Olea europaea var. sylvestris]